MNYKKKVLLGLSGGVDSTAAAIILKEKGYEVIAAHLKLIDNKFATSCLSPQALKDAKKTAEMLNIEFHVIDKRDDFNKTIIEPFIDSYKSGLTPNPCVLCNKKIKFGLMLDYAKSIGADFVATGHYAKILSENGKFSIHIPRNKYKDQSYMFYMLNQEQLSNILMPLGDIDDKNMVRNIVKKAGIPIYSKKDSQDICFVPDGDYLDFLIKKGVKLRPGDFVDEKGRKLGKHKGIESYTIGQRRGLGISSTEALYVKDINKDKNLVVLSTNKSLFSDFCYIKKLYLIDNDELIFNKEFEAKVRYSNKTNTCILKEENGYYKILFTDKIRAITPGQSLVLYENNRLIGGGIIVKNMI